MVSAPSITDTLAPGMKSPKHKAASHKSVKQL
jgi:hypothetical protein